jgi:hypothetical protein
MTNGGFADFETTTEVAERLGIDSSQVRRYCEQGRFEGAFKPHTRMWLIPRGTEPNIRNVGRRPEGRAPRSYEVRLDAPPAGYALESATEGQTARVAVREFTSSGDGEVFISRLEGIPQQLLSLLPLDAQVRPSMIDHLVAIIRKDLTATVYLNECEIRMQARSARPLEAGEAIFEDDIVDIARLSFEGVEFPPDAGVACVFSFGWRKGFFFDVEPLGIDGPVREYDVGELLGAYMAYLGNQQLFSLDEGDWNFLIERGWFPFASLPKQVTKNLVGFTKSRIDVDVVLPQMLDAVKAAVPVFRERWSGSQLLEPHLDLLLHALDEFEEGDYISCTSIVYPRIEGILRSIHEALGEEEGASQKVLTRVSTEAREEDLHPYSWLLPAPFRRFIEEAYFANFTPGQPATLSRNTVGHGVATAEQFNEKAACLGLLVVDQLFYYLPTNLASSSHS